MVCEARNEFKQCLSSINPIYASYTDLLWAKEVNSAAQLGNAYVPVMHACGVENPIHAGDVIAQSKLQQASGPILAVVSPLFIVQQVGCFRAHLDPQTSLELFAPQNCQHAYLRRKCIEDDGLTLAGR